MSSLTPGHRKQEAPDVATHEGLISGGLTLLPTSGALYIAMQNKTFLARTNWQSRTALVIMPALFVFAFTAEHSLANKMREMAKETQHGNATVEWAESELQKRLTTNKEQLQQRLQDCSNINNNIIANFVLVDFWSSGDVVDVVYEYNSILPSSDATTSTSTKSVVGKDDF